MKAEALFPLPLSSFNFPTRKLTNSGTKLSTNVTYSVPIFCYKLPEEKKSTMSCISSMCIATHLSNQHYSACVRRLPEMNCICYEVAVKGAAGEQASFGLSSSGQKQYPQYCLSHRARRKILSTIQETPLHGNGCVRYRVHHRLHKGISLKWKYKEALMQHLSPFLRRFPVL